MRNAGNKNGEFVKETDKILAWDLRISVRLYRKKILLKENEKTAIISLKKELAKRFKLVSLWLFGSKARGEDTQDSDIDVMIELAETNPEKESQIYDIVYEINLKNDAFICVIIFSKHEIDEGPMSESPIYKIIQKEGVLV